MEFTMHRSKIFPIDVCIDLGRRDVRVAEHLLDGAEVGAAFEEMGGEGVAEGVRGNRLRDAGAVDVAAEDFPCAHACERLAAGVEKQDTLPLALLQAWAKLADVGGNRADRRASDGDEPFLAAFAEDANEFFLENEIAHTKGDP